MRIPAILVGLFLLGVTLGSGTATGNWNPALGIVIALTAILVSVVLGIGSGLAVEHVKQRGRR